MKCEFELAWRGTCGKENCTDHNLTCCSCGAPAIHECDQTMGLVCGAPLCNDCEHILTEAGVNGHGHCKKVDQKYKPWWQQEPIEVSAKLTPTEFARLTELGMGGCPHSTVISAAIDLMFRMYERFPTRSFQYIAENGEQKSFDW